MANTNGHANRTETIGDTAENVISAKPCILYGIYPRLTTTGTITTRNTATAAGGAVEHICAIGLTQQGKTFGPKGVIYRTGLTIQLSVASDLCTIAWEPL